MYHVYAGSPDDADERGEGAGAAFRQARPVDVYPDAQPRLHVQLQVPLPGLINGAHIFKMAKYHT